VGFPRGEPRCGGAFGARSRELRLQQAVPAGSQAAGAEEGGRWRVRNCDHLKLLLSTEDLG